MNQGWAFKFNLKKNSFYEALNFTSLKKFVVCLCFAFLIQGLNAQSPILTAVNSSPHLGDTLIFVSSNTNNYDTGHSGVNQVWDYSALTDSLDGNGKLVVDTQVCVAPSATPFAINFPNAPFATTHTNSPIPYYFYYSNNKFFD